MIRKLVLDILVKNKNILIYILHENLDISLFIDISDFNLKYYNVHSRAYITKMFYPIVDHILYVT